MSEFKVHTRLEEIFLRALELSEADRPAFLDQACAHDASLRQQADILLRQSAVVSTAYLRGAVGLSLLTTRSEVLPIQVDRYSLVARLGEGAFGVVYRATQHTPVRRELAVKVLRPGLDSAEIIRRFEAERQALANLDHPNVARLYDAGNMPDGRPYFAMELFRGEPLTRFCDGQRMPLRWRIVLMLDVCAALEHAHRRGILHRDLKPSNILAARSEDGALVVKVIDFGIARALGSVEGGIGSVMTETGRLLGTPEYMSPEQVDGDAAEVDTRADVYALGVVLYELLAGRLPFTSEELRGVRFSELRRKVCTVSPPSPSALLDADPAAAEQSAAARGTTAAALVQSLKAEIEWVPLRAMRKAPADRYRSVADLGDDLRNYLAGRPLVAGPDTAAYRLRKFVRRHRSLVVTTLVVASLLVAAVVGTTTGMIEARRQRRLTELQLAQTLVVQGELELQQSHYLNAWNAAASSRRIQTAQGGNTLQADLALYSVLAAADPPVVVMNASQRNLDYLTFTDGGKTLISSGPDGTVEWEANLGQPLRRYPFHVLGVSSDGNTLYAQDADSALRAYDRQSLAPELLFPDSPRGNNHRLAVSPNGRWVVMCDMGAIVVWDARSARKIGRFKVSETLVNTVAFSPDGARMAIAVNDLRTLPVWDTQTWKEQTRVGVSESPIDLAFTPDGGRVLVGGWTYLAEIVDLSSGKIVRTLKGHQQEISRVLVSSDGAWGVTVSRDTQVRVWGTPDQSLDRPTWGHAKAVSAAAIAPDDTFATAAQDGEIRIWNRNVRKAEHRLTQDDLPQRYVFPLSPDGRFSLEQSPTSAAPSRVWDVRRASIQSTLDTGPYPLIGLGTRFTTSGDVIGATGDPQTTVFLWDPRTGKRRKTLITHGGLARGVIATTDARRAITYGDRTGVKFWNLESGALLWCRTDQTPVHRECAISDDGRYAALSTAGGSIEVLEIETGHAVRTLPTLPQSDQFAYAIFDPRDSHRLMWYHEADQRLRMVDLRDRSDIYLAGDQSIQRSAWFLAADNKTLILRNGDGRLDFYDLADGQFRFTWPSARRIRYVSTSADLSVIGTVTLPDERGRVADLDLGVKLAELEPSASQARQHLAAGNATQADKDAVVQWRNLLLQSR